MDPVPSCFTTDKSFNVESTIHVYFSKHAKLTSNCNPIDLAKNLAKKHP